MKARRSAPAPCALPVGSSEQPRAMTPRARRAGPRFAAGPIARGPQPRGRLRVNRALRPEQTLPILAPTCRPSNTTGRAIGGLTRGLQTRASEGPAPCHRQPSPVSWSPRLAQRPSDVLSLMLLGENTGMVPEKLAQRMPHGLLGVWIQARLHQALQLSRYSVWQLHFQRLHDRSVGRGLPAVKSRNPSRSRQR